MEFLRRLRYLMNRRRMDRELAGEMAFHREMMGPDGRAAFGNALRLREESQEAWGWMWLDRLGQDLRYASRKLLAAPGFTLAAVAMLAIGIGANVAVFSFFDLMVLRPLPVKDPATLVRFHRRSPDKYAFAMPYPEFAFFRDYAKTLSSTLALHVANLAVEGEPKQITAHFVSANFFSDLGATAQLGRALDPVRDEAAGAEPVAVLSHGFWQRHFGGKPDVIGSTMHLNGKPVLVVGVAFEKFGGLSLDKPDLWAPITEQPYFEAGSQLLTGFGEDTGVRMWGRIRPGSSPRAAEEELGALAAQLRHAHPNDIWENETLPGEPGGFANSLRVGDRRGSGTEAEDKMFPVWALACTFGLLILGVACGNLGSLLVARGVSRQREMSIRVALGAGRGRLVRQLFTESLMLGLIGSVAGLLLGYIVLRSLMALTGTPAWLTPAPDLRVAGFALGMGFLAAVLFGLTPSWQLARQRQRVNFLRQMLVAAQVAASCVLLIVAGLLVSALNHALSANPGFEYQKVIAIDPALFTHGYSTAQARTYLDVFAQKLRALPGVESVALTDTPPLGRRQSVASVTVDGRRIAAHLNNVDPQFFGTMRIPIVRGRNMTAADQNVVVVSQTMARMIWPGEDPLGKHFSLDGSEAVVIGVSGAERLVAIEDSDAVEAYFPYRPENLPGMVLLARTSGPTQTALQSASQIARSIDPNLFPQVQALTTSFREKMQGAENGALVVSILGLVGQLLACLGIVGVVAFVVSQKAKEIGIRMALGAKPVHVLAVVIRQFSLPVLGGLVVGVGSAAALSGLLRGELYGVSNLDPVSYLGAIGLFAITAAIAALLPARRALQIDPVLTLRQD